MSGRVADGVTGHQHDFDFEFGAWAVSLRRLVRPLTGSDEWVDYTGTSVVREVWGGRANLGELEVDHGSEHLEGLSLRLFNPLTESWSIYWANSENGEIGPPMVGRFESGVGTFFNEEIYRGTLVRVRFVFLDITLTSFRFEQSFSSDGGLTWETNCIASFTRSLGD
jgi:hypothetical protein